MKKILLILIILSNLANAKIIMKPYLQAVTDNSVLVMIESDSKEKIKVTYSEKSNSSNNLTATSTYFKEADTEPKTYVHRILLHNLKAKTTYLYSVDYPEMKFESEFKTLLSKNDKSSFKFASYGDSRSGIKPFAKISEGILSKNPDFSIYLGDLSYDPSYKLWKDEFFIENQLKLAAKVPFFNAVGNHEKWSINTQAFTDSPINSFSNEKAYYSFDCGDFHFLILSTEHNVKKNSPQWEFAKKDLESSQAKWKVVAFHIPAYCAGAHNENKSMKFMSQELFETYKVDLVLTGHSHFYQHNFVAGIHHLVLGGGGSPLYPPTTASYVIKSAKVYHYGLFNYSNNELNIDIFDIDNNKIDNFKIKK